MLSECVNLCDKIFETLDEEHKTPNELKTSQWCEFVCKILETSFKEHKIKINDDKDLTINSIKN